MFDKIRSTLHTINYILHNKPLCTIDRTEDGKIVVELCDHFIDPEISCPAFEALAWAMKHQEFVESRKATEEV